VEDGVAELRERLIAAVGDRYQVEDLVGVGGMALVFRAVDPKHGRTVAIKVLRPELAATVGAERFLREIRIAANLTHPHILPLHDSGEADGILYYVMPFVEGESLRERMDREGPLAVEHTLRIVQEVGQGLSHAHAAGIIHRDVKPDNVLLSGGVAVIADFGIARATEAAESVSLTRTGAVPSTPRYASPEQAWDEKDIDHRTDQYSLASIAFEMLAGRSPFDGRSARAILALQASEDAPSVHTFREGLPDEVGSVLSKALSRDPADRYGSTAEFVEEFRSALGYGGARVRRSPSLVAVASASIVVGALAVAYAAFGGAGSEGGDPRAQDQEAVLAVIPFDHVGSPETSYFTDGMTDEVATRIGGIQGVAVVSLASSRFADPSVQSLQEIGDALGATHLLLGAIRIDQPAEGAGRIRFTPRLVRVSDSEELWSEPQDADLVPGEIFDVQSSIADQVARALDLAFLPDQQVAFERPTESLEAYDYFLRANPLSAQFLVAEDAQHSIEMYEQAVALDPQFARAYAGLGRTQSLYYYFWDRTPERLELAREAVRQAVALAPDHPETHVARGYLAYWGSLDYGAAMEAFDEAGAGESSDSELLWVVASVQRRQGHFDEALESFKRGFRLDPRSNVNAFEVAGTLVMLKRYEEALPYARQARALAPDWLPGLMEEVVVLADWGRIEEAQAYMAALAESPTNVQRMLPQLLGEMIYRSLWDLAIGDPFWDALAESDAGIIVDPAAYYRARTALARRQGDPAAARAYADSSVAVLTLRLQDNPDDDWTRIDLASALVDALRGAEASAWLEGIDPEGLVEVDAFRGAFWAMELARAYLKLGDGDAALDIIEYLAGVPGPASMTFLAVDPTLSSLRSNPRFQALLAIPSAQSTP